MDTSDSCSFLFVSVLQLGSDSSSAEERFHRLSVLGAHAVVDEDVKGRVDVGVDLQEPERRKVRVLVTASCVQFWHNKQHQPAA